MNIDITKLAEEVPNIVGELLRHLFFVQGKKNGQLGCYSTFEIHEDVVFLDKKFDERYDCFVHRHQKIVDDKIVTMEYYWDGDGCLKFTWDGHILDNGDCKKTHGWDFRIIK